jgi:hypothetical protein
MLRDKRIDVGYCETARAAQSVPPAARHWLG